ncbi:hypothetical protein IJ103_00420 [Candidatus Saccharibacteria bacterium]|nr:hypothetical protein [Candidatus Saccharibacteria bacterium]
MKKKIFSVAMWPAIIAAVVLGIISFGIYRTKAAKEQDEPIVEKATEITDLAEAPKAITLEYDPMAEVKKARASWADAKGEISEAELAVLASGNAYGQIDEADEEFDSDEAMKRLKAILPTGPRRTGLRNAYKVFLNCYEGADTTKIEIYPVSDSFPMNIETKSAKDPETGKSLIYERIHSGEKNDFVNYEISFATARVFGSKQNDEDSFKEQLYYLVRNYVAFVELLDEWGEATTLGVENREIWDFFDVGIAIANKNQEIPEDAEEAPGVYAILEPGSDGRLKYTTEWENVMVDFIIWADRLSYEGTYEWYTRERGYLGPADGTAHDDVRYDFDESIANTRANFTTDPERQVNLPSEIVSIRDKGIRVSDFMGINLVTSDAELYTEAPKVKKATLDKVKDGGEITVVDYTLPTKQQPSGSTKVTYTASTGEVKPAPTPTPKPKKYDKKKEADPQYKPENAIIAGVNIGENLDPFQPVGSVPQTWSTEVATSQGGNESAYTQAIESGSWEPSGESNNNTPSPGTTVVNATVTDEKGEEHTATETWHQDDNTGANVADADYSEPTSDGGSEDVHVNHAEAETEAPHDVDTSDHESSGSESSGNTSDWDGDESF